MSPLSDRAPRGNGDAGRPSEYYEVKATSKTPLIRVFGFPEVQEQGMSVKITSEPGRSLRWRNKECLSIKSKETILRRVLFPLRKSDLLIVVVKWSNIYGAKG